MDHRWHVGTHLYPGLPIVTNGARLSSEIPAPLLGQHNEEVFASSAISSRERPHRLDRVGRGIVLQFRTL